MTTLRTAIQNKFLEIFSREVVGAETPLLNDETVLLSTGLDSLGFAVLVVELEESLGFDPFSLAEEAYYPQTFGEFVAFYEKHQPKG
jgi:acyl carrier protein